MWFQTHLNTHLEVARVDHVDCAISHLQNKLPLRAHPKYHIISIVCNLSYVKPLRFFNSRTNIFICLDTYIYTKWMYSNSRCKLNLTIKDGASKCETSPNSIEWASKCEGL